MMPKAAEPIPFGALLRHHRIAAGLTQEALAERTGLGVRSIQHLEGGVHLPHRGTVDRLLRVLDLSGMERRRFEGAAQPAPRPREAVSTSPGEISIDRAPSHNLPAQLTSFVGRERELAEVARLLGGVPSGSRLLTVTGVGGTGKTRLALQVASRFVGSDPDGVWFVDLAPLVDPALVPWTVANAVGVSEQPGEPILTTLLRALRDRNLLLLLDNCEHLINPCAHLADAILRACPGVRILATSREALGMPGEVIWPVPTLEVPPGPAHSAENLVQSAAARLFLDRAAAASPRFSVTDQNAPAIARICQRLAGIPLALELAAARVGGLAVEQIATRLDDRFLLLTGGNRTAQPRQQTLQATVDWSYELLTRPERLLFHRLATFVGGFALEATEAIGAGPEVRREEVLGHLLRLVDKSLVVAEHAAKGEARYRLLETLHQYAGDRLAASAEAEDARRRHATYYLDFAAEGAPNLTTEEKASWLDRLEGESDNLRAALAWCRQNDPMLGLRLAGQLGDFWLLRGYRTEGGRWLADLLAAAPGRTMLQARALHVAGMLKGDQVDLAQPLLEESLVLYREASHQRGVAATLRALGWLARIQTDYERAQSLLAESLTISREVADRSGIAVALYELANVARKVGDHDRAYALAEESLTLYEQIGDRFGIAINLGQLGNLARSRGDYSRARALFEENLAYAQELRNKEGISWALSNLGNVVRIQGDDRRARELFAECLALETDQETASHVSLFVLLSWGMLSVDQGAHRRGARMIGASQALQQARRVVGATDPDEAADRDAHLAVARAALGEEAFAQAWAEGQAMTREQAVAYARSDEAHEDKPV